MTKHLKEHRAIGRVSHTTDARTVHDRMGGHGPAPLWARLTYLMKAGSYNELPKPLVAMLWVLAAAVSVGWMFLAVIHIDDRYLVNADLATDDFRAGGNSAVWMGHVQATLDGHFYPPLYENGYYAGTRYGPLPILLWSGLARVTGDLLISGKLLAYLIAVSLLTLLFRLLRRVDCPRPLAFALTAALLVTVPGLQATTSTARGDALAVVLQLVGVALVRNRSNQLAAAAAGFSCALAVTGKISALWAPVAIMVWMILGHEWRRLVTFLGAFGLSQVAFFAAFHALSHGRMVENLRTLLFAGSNSGGLLNLPQSLAAAVVYEAPLLLTLAPLVLVALAKSARTRQPTLWQLALVIATVITAVVLIDDGAGANHLLDVIVLSLVVVGELAGAAGRRIQLTTVGMVLAGCVGSLVVGILGTSAPETFGRTIANDVAETAAALAAGRPVTRWSPRPLDGYLTPGGTILAEDPYVPLSAGQKPTVLDPWMLARLGRHNPAWLADLGRRVEAHEFSQVVLSARLEDNRHRYAESTFGPQMFTALCSNYRLQAVVLGYWVYVPDQDEPPGARSSTGPGECTGPYP